MRPMASPHVKFLFSQLVMVIVNQIAYKSNRNMPSIPEAPSASSEIHIAPHMQTSECVQVQSCGFDFKNKNQKNSFSICPLKLAARVSLS